MNAHEREVLNTVDKIEQATELNKYRTEWNLVDWSAYFEKDIPGEKPHIMTPDEIASAILWLTKHGYPVPNDCPKRPESAQYDGGCPAFKPVCLTHHICQMARGMCKGFADVVVCPMCNKEFNIQTDLRNTISKKEFEISGLCQRCQDSVFGRDCDDKYKKILLSI